MRFAGSKLEDFMGKGTDFGLLTQEASAITGRDDVASIRRKGEGVGVGIGAAGAVARAEYNSQAAAVEAQAQANANTMSTIGDVISSGISALPKLGGGGASQVNFGSSDWTNTTASFGNYAKSYL